MDVENNQLVTDGKNLGWKMVPKLVTIIRIFKNDSAPNVGAHDANNILKTVMPKIIDDEISV